MTTEHDVSERLTDLLVRRAQAVDVHPDLAAVIDESSTIPLDDRVAAGDPRRRSVRIVAGIAAAIIVLVGVAVVARSGSDPDQPVASDGPPPSEQGPGPADARLTIYLAVDVSDETLSELHDSLEEDPAVERFVYLDEHASYDEFVEKFKDSPEFTDVIEPEILPTSFKVVPEDASDESLQRIKELYEGEPGVVQVLVH